MQIPEKPTVTKLVGIKPIDGWVGAVFHIDPPIIMVDGTVANHVTTSFGSETLLGEGNTFAVFISDKQGKFLDWQGFYFEGEGPDWCLSLLDLSD